MASQMINKFLAITVLIFSAMTVNAVSVDVGLVDTLIAQVEKGEEGAPKNSSSKSELSWASSVLGDISLEYATEQSNVSYLASLDSGSIYQFMLSGRSDYCVLKNSAHWASYENESSLFWAVLNASALSDGFNLNGDGTLSHVRGFNSVNPPPIFGSAALFSLALAGFVFFRRKFKA